MSQRKLADQPLDKRMRGWAKDKEELAVHDEIISFTINKTLYEIDLIHNFHVLNLDIEKALHSWAIQATEYNIDSFCHYVMLNGNYERNSIICFPTDKWTNFINNQEKDT